MPHTSALTRVLRRLVGLPHERGIYTRHPEFNRRKSRGRLEHGADGQTRFVPEDSVDDFADLERGDAHVRSHDTRPRTGIDAPLALLEEKVFRMGAAGEGDVTELSVSLAEDVWHMLTVDLPVSRLLLLEISLEVCVIVSFAVVLLVVDIAESSTEDGADAPGALLRGKLLLSLTAVSLMWVASLSVAVALTDALVEQPSAGLVQASCEHAYDSARDARSDYDT